jgi:hypothetical protein
MIEIARTPLEFFWSACIEPLMKLCLLGAPKSRSIGIGWSWEHSMRAPATQDLSGLPTSPGRSVEKTSQLSSKSIALRSTSAETVQRDWWQAEETSRRTAGIFM